ncbi:type VI secretion system ImpA family N-terminal domain-containing protein, partial [Pantoea endophytica]
MPSSRAKLIKTGGDPRLYPAFATLTYEIQKLHHPARPDINWQNASRLCLTLFEANGVELQTAVWFTFCRAHNNGVQGMTEGLSVVTELLIKNGDLCWPESVHARLNLLSDMSRYLQRFLRTQTLSRTDLDTLSQSAVLLAELGEYLQRIGMRQQSQLDVLRDRIMDSVLLLEQRDMSDRIAREITDETGGPPDVHPLSAAMASSPERWVYVSHEKCAPADVSITKRRAFLAGAGAAILSAMMIVAGIYTFMTDPVRDELMSSVDLFATVLSADTVHQLSVTQPDWLQNDSVWLEKTGEKLDWLTSASPFWLFEHGNAP